MNKRLVFERVSYYFKSINKPDAVFIWIPKTAGTSVYEVLATHGCHQLKRGQLVKDYFFNQGLVTFVHQDYAKLLTEGYVSQRFDQRAFKFCFVRNPYSRTVSLFFYLKKVGRIERDLSFLAFTQALAQTNIPDIGLYNVNGLSQCNPQTRWLQGIKIDYMGQFENLSTDFNQILSHLGLPIVEAVPKTNTTDHKEFEAYYCQESKRIVEDYYAEDFERFNYPIGTWL